VGGQGDANICERDYGSAKQSHHQSYRGDRLRRMKVPSWGEERMHSSGVFDFLEVLVEWKTISEKTSRCKIGPHSWGRKLRALCRTWGDIEKDHSNKTRFKIATAKSGSLRGTSPQVKPPPVWRKEGYLGKKNARRKEGPSELDGGGRATL